MEFAKAVILLKDFLTPTNKLDKGKYYFFRVKADLF
jgi:hypothetical protein